MSYSLEGKTVTCNEIHSIKNQWHTETKKFYKKTNVVKIPWNPMRVVVGKINISLPRSIDLASSPPPPIISRRSRPLTRWRCPSIHRLLRPVPGQRDFHGRQALPDTVADIVLQTKPWAQLFFFLVVLDFGSCILLV